MSTAKIPEAPHAAISGSVAFITGCGRSGTTILGQILAQHPHVSYLNDRFDVWVEPLPVTDIWGQRELRGGRGAPDIGCLPRVALTCEDARHIEADARQRLFARLNAERRGRPLLVEKLAINNFRMGFILELCPSAAIINIVRHGVEVARSIERRAAGGEWYGRDDRKWRLLEEHARDAGYERLLPLCDGPYERALLEWRMSVDAAMSFFRSTPLGRVHHLRYEDLLADPVHTAQKVETFLGLPPAPEVYRFCAAEVRRRNPAAHELPVPPTTDAIAGEALRRLGYTLPGVDA